MNRFTAFLIVPALAAPLFAEAPPARDPSMAPEVQDVVYFSEERPILFRLHLFTNGKPADEEWSHYMHQWFEFLDRSANGFLDDEELQKAPNVGFLMQTYRGMGYNRSATRGPTRNDFDRDNDNKVSRSEFVRYYRNTTAGPFQIGTSPSTMAVSDALTRSILTALDTDKDGKLSKAETSETYARLRKYDGNDDEVVTSQEIQSANTVRNLGRNLQMSRMGGNMQSSAPLMLIPHENEGGLIEVRLQAAKALLARLDMDDDNKLTPKESRLPAATFADLDRNKDNSLAPLELLRWLIVKPDLEIVVPLGPDTKSAKAVTLQPDSAPLPKSFQVEHPSENEIGFLVGRTRVFLTRVVEPTTTTVFQTARRNVETQFNLADPKKTGVVRANQLTDRRFYYLRLISRNADRNLDGNLTRAEVDTWLDLLTSARDATVKLTHLQQGTGLFGTLDANGDGRLSTRELKHAWSQLERYDSDEDGILAMSDIPKQARLLLGFGDAGLRASYRYRQPGAVVRPRPTRERGPTWFVRMDRNGDGDVSPREFLGTPEQFTRLDTNKDEILSPEEATNFARAKE